ncbi:MAG: leucine-rich repeat domain-containing protein, partial [Spirochaetota bacterium]|nr:leucine-rich repeat domain-containing protein [Spirochaetota bacterium]
SLKEMKNLKELELSVCKIGNLNPIKELVRLEFLILHRNKLLSDLSPLKNLDNLKYLDISYTNVSDLSPLKNLKNLKTIVIWDPKVKNFLPLKSLKNLKQLTLSQIDEHGQISESKSKYSDKEKEEIKRLLPNCKITF